MNRKRTTLSTSIAIAMGSISCSATANLVSSATLNFTLGLIQDVGDGQIDVVGSWFAFDTDGSTDIEPFEKQPIGSFNGIHIGAIQAAGGSHSGSVNGSESPNIDSPWTYYGGTGMHQTTSPITVISDFGSYKTLDLSGWNMTWTGIPSIPFVPVGDAIISCDQSSCSDSSSYTLDAAFHTNGAGLTTIGYVLHLEGHVSYVPIPATAWLFGSGLLGLVGISRRKKTD